MYDFESRIDRSGTGSSKWDLMYETNPDVSKGVMPMSIADMEFKNAPEIIEGLKEHLNDAVLGYTQPTQSYYDAVLKWFKRRHHVDLDQEWIVLTPGVVQGIYNVVQQFSKPGDHVVVFRPVYYPFFPAIEDQGRVLENCPLILDEEGYHIDYDRFDELTQRDENKLLLFCSPQNPIGRVWSKEELTRLADICVKNGVTMMSDEIHSDLIMSDAEHTSMVSLDHPIKDQLIVMTAPSKTFNLAGAGISNILIPNADVRAHFVKGLQDHFVHVSNALAYKMTELAFNEGEAWLDECLEVIEKNRNLCYDFFAKQDKMKVYPLQGTYLLWVDCNGLGLTPKELEHFMTHDAEIFTDQGYIFGPEGEGFERLNIAMPTAVLKETLERLDRAVKNL